jgi:hypothetical protein
MCVCVLLTCCVYLLRSHVTLRCTFTRYVCMLRQSYDVLRHVARSLVRMLRFLGEGKGTNQTPPDPGENTAQTPARPRHQHGRGHCQGYLASPGWCLGRAGHWAVSGPCWFLGRAPPPGGRQVSAWAMLVTGAVFGPCGCLRHAGAWVVLAWCLGRAGVWAVLASVWRLVGVWAMLVSWPCCRLGGAWLVAGPLLMLF